MLRAPTRLSAMFAAPAENMSLEEARTAAKDAVLATQWSVLPHVNPLLCRAHQRLAFVIDIGRADSRAHHTCSDLPYDVLREVCTQLSLPSTDVANETFLRIVPRQLPLLRGGLFQPGTKIDAKTGQVIRWSSAGCTKADLHVHVSGTEDGGVGAEIIAELNAAKALGDDAALQGAMTKLIAQVVR